jgi:hypothetical protein
MVICIVEDADIITVGPAGAGTITVGPVGAVIVIIGDKSGTN